MKLAKQFFAFMNEREQVRLNKEAGKPWPWTLDPILQKYKFTNVKRLHDRTTQWFLHNLYDKRRDEPLPVILFNCAVARYFGTIEFMQAVGWQKTFHPGILKNTAKYRLEHGEKVFTGAYVVTNGGIKAPKYQVVVDEYLAPLWEAAPTLVIVARETKRWEMVARAMYKLPGLGGSGFMTKEILQDAILTPLLEDAVDRKTWSPCGPGARRGLNRIWNRPTDAAFSEARGLEEMRELLTAAPDHLAPYMPELELHDIQFQLCEFDKYMRVQLGQGRPRSMYRIPE